MNKPFEFGMILGRFQNFHIGHYYMIKKGLLMCDTLLVFVGSAQESRTLRNPFPADKRMQVIKDCFPVETASNQLIVEPLNDLTNESDHSHEWGFFVLQNAYHIKQKYGIEAELDAMIYGNDEERKSWYHPSDTKNVSNVILSRNRIQISGTQMRRYLLEKRFVTWNSYMPTHILGYDQCNTLFNHLREALLSIPDYEKDFYEALQS